MITKDNPVNSGDFNQITYDTARSWTNVNGAAFANYVSSNTDDKIEQAISDGCNVVILTGFGYADAIETAAAAHSDVKFVGLDFTTENSYSNLYCATYREELAGFMAGYAAVKMGNTKLGFLGGMAIPAVVRYGYGFVQGAEAAAQADNKTGVEVKYVYANSFAPDEDDEITNAVYQWYWNGTEVVFSSGGGIWAAAANAAAAAAENKPGGTYKVIGVDMDQKDEIDTAYGDGLTVTSAMKGLAATVNTQLKRIRDNAFVSGNDNLGLVSSVNPSVNYVQLPLSSTQWNATFTQADYTALLADMIGGTIQVDDDTDADPTDFANMITVSVQADILPQPGE